MTAVIGDSHVAVDVEATAIDRRLRSLLDRTPVGIAEVEIATGRFLQVNARLCAILGRSRDELLELCWADVTHPDDLDLSNEAVLQLRTGTVGNITLEKRYLRRDGKIVWGRLSVSRDELAGGSAHTSVVAIEDITALRLANDELRARPLRRQLTLETGPLATWSWDLASHQIELDDHAQRLFGFDRSIVTDGELSQRVHPDDAFTPQQIAELCKTGQSTLLRRIIRPDGEVRWLDARASVEFAGEGDDRRAVRITVVAHDITSELRTQRELRTSEERYYTLVDSLENIVFTLDPGGRLTFVNKAVQQTGRTPAECIGRRLLDFIHPSDLSRAKTLEQRRLDGTLDGPVEYRTLDVAGKPRHVRITTRRLPGGEGFVGTVIDLSAMRLAEEQLRAAQKMEAIGRLAGGIAHDFNNLLTVIVTSADFALAEAPVDQPLYADLDQIMRAAHRASALTRQLLAFSRRQVLLPEQVQLERLVDSLAKMLERLIGEDIELVLSAGAELPPVMVDRGQMEQVVMNLVVNARDAMPRGGKIMIATDAIELEDERAIELALPVGRYVRLTVRDTGGGIAPEVLAQVFEPFFTTKEVGKGTGLGLSTVYGIVKQSRGSVTVESTVGAGTAFSILLPAERPSLTSLQRPATTDRPRGHETILVVEDDAALRTTVARALAEAGYQVLRAATPNEALRLATEHGRRLQLIFTDVVMPEMNGCELVARLRSFCPHARVLYTSGYTNDALERSGVKGSEFLAKPYDPSELRTRVRALLDD